MPVVVALLTLALWSSPIQAATLTVYTYDSFTAEWGPGPRLEQMFEARCGCTLDFVALEDAAAILSRIRFEGEATKADVALGLDTGLTAGARQTGLFAPHGLDVSGLAVPGGFDDPVFVPYDYGYFAFVFDSTRGFAPPASMRELVDGAPDLTLLIEDPRTSSPGLGLLLWIRKLYGDGAPEAWARLAPRIVTVTQGWSEAYGLFQKGEADMVLSYTTSPAYHITAENETKYKAAAFAEGHYRQIEVAARLAGSANASLAGEFLAFLVSREAQGVIPATQWMYPVRDVGDALPASFGELIEVRTPLSFTPEEVRDGRAAWVEEWLAAMSR